MKLAEIVTEVKAEVDLDDLRSMYSDLAEPGVEFDEKWTVTNSIKSFFDGALSDPVDHDVDAKRKRAIKAVLKSPELMKKLAALVKADIDAHND